VKRVEFAPAARAELDAAATDYEREREGLGATFYSAVERTVRLIGTFPEVGPSYPGIPSELQVRRRVVRGFPFVLAYRELGEMIRIDAVAHSRRRPDYWLRRVQK
jgi:toxin ParE1/3/4